LLSDLRSADVQQLSEDIGIAFEDALVGVRRELREDEVHEGVDQINLLVLVNRKTEVV